MTPSHEQVLAEIEARVDTPEADLDGTDARIAAELGVNADDYRIYLWVWAAIEVYRHTTAAETDSSRRCGDLEALADAEAAADRMAAHSETIHHQAGAASRRSAEIADQATAALGAVARLRECLAELSRVLDTADASQAPEPG
jgi:hypothetical protein